MAQHNNSYVCKVDVFPVKMIVADSMMIDVILGRDFLKTHQCTVNLSKDRDVLYGGQNSCQDSSTSGMR